MVERLVVTVVFLVECAAACWNASDIPLGLSDLTVYNVPVSAEDILKGPLYQIGDYDACVYRREQQYCLVNVYLHPSENASDFWHEKQRLSLLATNFRRDRLFVGLCVPESCNITQIQMAMFNKLRPAADHFGINATVALDPKDCQDRNKPYVFADYLMCIIILIIAALVISGSIYEYRSGPKTKESIVHGPVAQILQCFSVISNWKNLCSISGSPKEKSLRCIQGIRFYTSIFVVAGHEGYGMMLSPKKNPEWIEDSYSEVSRMFFVNGHLITCSFFVISGFMLAYQRMEMLDRKGFSLSSYLNVLAHRYFRLTPALAVVIVFVAGWLNHLASGPLWQIGVKEDVDNCRQHWWLNLLYLNNYILADQMVKRSYRDKEFLATKEPIFEQVDSHLELQIIIRVIICLLQTWYLAVDFQSYILFFLLLGVITKYKLWIKVTFGSILAICICIPLVQTYVEQLEPTFLTYPEHMMRLKDDRTFMRNYITFHHNAGPYFVGVIFGYILYRKNTNGSNISKFTVAVLWAASLTLPWAAIFLGYFFYQPNFEYNVVIASIYAALNKMVFATGIASIIFLCSMGYGGILNTFFSSKLLQILGRLTYSVYLIHPALLRAEYASSKQIIQLSDYFMISKTVTHTTIAILFSLLLYLFVEMPISALFKLATASKSKDSKIPLHMRASVCCAPLNDKAAEKEEEEQTEKQQEEQFPNIRL